MEIDMKHSINVMIAMFVIGLPCLAFAASEDLAKQASVALPEARAIATKAFYGRIVKEELEQEKGGSGLRYSFIIANGKITHEVGVDAKTGKILENGVEATNND
jgi:uncharacterized membrane protein YkoI